MHMFQTTIFKDTRSFFNHYQKKRSLETIGEDIQFLSYVLETLNAQLKKPNEKIESLKDELNTLDKNIKGFEKDLNHENSYLKMVRDKNKIDLIKSRLEEEKRKKEERKKELENNLKNISVNVEVKKIEELIRETKWHISQLKPIYLFDSIKTDPTKKNLQEKLDHYQFLEDFFSKKLKSFLYDASSDEENRQDLAEVEEGSSSKPLLTAHANYLNNYLHNLEKDDEDNMESNETMPSDFLGKIKFLVKSVLKKIGRTRFFRNLKKISDSIFGAITKGAQAADDVPSAIQAGEGESALLPEELAETVGTYLLSAAGFIVFTIQGFKSTNQLLAGIADLFNSSISRSERFFNVALPSASLTVSMGGLVITGMLIASLFVAVAGIEFLPFFVTVGVALIAGIELIETFKEYRKLKQKAKKNEANFSAAEKTLNDYLNSNEKKIKSLKKSLAEIEIQKKLAPDQETLLFFAKKQKKLEIQLFNLQKEFNQKKEQFSKQNKIRTDAINVKHTLNIAATQFAISIAISAFVFAATAAFIGATAAGSLGIVPSIIIISLATVSLGIKLFQEIVKWQSGRNEYTYMEAAKDLFWTYPKNFVCAIGRWLSPQPTASKEVNQPNKLSQNAYLRGFFTGGKKEESDCDSDYDSDYNQDGSIKYFSYGKEETEAHEKGKEKESDYEQENSADSFSDNEEIENNYGFSPHTKG